MRLLKVIILIITMLCIICAVSYSERLTIINKIAKDNFGNQQTTVTEIDFHLDDNMAIIVDNLSLKTPIAKFEITDLSIQWQLSLAPKITAVKIETMKVTGVAPLYEDEQTKPIINPTSEKQNISQFLSTTLKPSIRQLTQLQFPIALNIERFTYFPFSKKNTESQYAGSFSVRDNHFNFSLRNGEDLEFIKVQLAINDKNLNLNTTSKLDPLTHFASIHHLPINTTFRNALTTTDISGDINTVINYQDDTLVINNKTTDLIINSPYGIKEIGAFKLFGDLNFQTKIHLSSERSRPVTNDKNELMSLTFNEKNKLGLNFSQSKLINFLVKNQISEDIILIIKDNPIDQITIATNDNSVININDDYFVIDNAELIAKSNVHPQKIVLEDINFKFSDSTDEGANQLSIRSFDVQSMLTLSKLSTLTNKPVNIHLVGSLTKTDKQTKLTLSKQSSIELTQIKLSEPKNNETTKPTAPKLTINTMNTDINGTVWVQKNNHLILDLNINNQSSQLSIPKTLQLKKLLIKSHIQGELDNIIIEATTIADNVVLGQLTMTGSIQSPIVELSGDKIALAELFALKIKLPTKIALIDGYLDYKVTSEKTDFANILNNKFSALLAVTSLSGEINGMWIQQLDWQQHFMLSDGYLTTPPNKENNLTIGLIDTPTPISQFTTNLGISYKDNFSLSATSLKANILGGSFDIPKVQWPLMEGHSVNVQLTSIDLEQVLALDKKQGIVVTGNISGVLPITFDGKKYTIKKGNLFNINNGLIQVVNNPAVAELKKSNQELQLAFDALQNLHYNQLSSSVSLAEDGYMILETVIKGRNPDIDNDVNLNLNLSYDLPGLLESLSITERFENNLIKKLQTH